MFKTMLQSDVSIWGVKGNNFQLDNIEIICNTESI